MGKNETEQIASAFNRVYTKYRNEKVKIVDSFGLFSCWVKVIQTKHTHTTNIYTRNSKGTQDTIGLMFSCLYFMPYN